MDISDKKSSHFNKNIIKYWEDFDWIIQHLIDLWEQV